MSAVFCQACGHKNPAEANFCSSCGAALVGAGTDDTTTMVVGADGLGEGADEEVSIGAHEAPEGLGVVVVKRGPNAGSRFVLEADVTRAGRHPESEIFLDDITVSRRHAEFVREGSRYAVRDVGSLNGTYLNRERLEQAPLQHGDEIQIGKFKLVFLATGAG